MISLILRAPSWNLSFVPKAPKALALEVVRARKPDAPQTCRRTDLVQKYGEHASPLKVKHPSKHLMLAKDTNPTCTIYGYSETVKLRLFLRVSPPEFSKTCDEPSIIIAESSQIVLINHGQIMVTRNIS